MKIPIIYDGGARDWTAEDVRAVMACVTATGDVLERAGHDVTHVPVDLDLNWFPQIRDADLVFNLCEGIGGLSHLEYPVAAAVELLGVPHTGVSAWTMSVCHRKNILNAILDGRGLPVPEWYAPDSDDDVRSDFSLPAIVKPTAEDASVGIDQEAIVTTHDQLQARIRQSREKYGGVLVQRYIAGREFAVGFVGDETLPLSEIDFAHMPDGSWHVVTFEAKWTPGSAEDRGTQPVCPANVSSDLASELVGIATAAWQVVDGSGYGRVDMRVDGDGRPWVLEVNPNPDSSTDAGLANMASAAGWSYDELVLRILEASMATAEHTSRLMVES